VLAVRHQNRPGVLAHVFKVLLDERINVEEVENIAYHGAEAASARIHVSEPPSQAALEQIQRGNQHVISVDIREVRR
jgi:D-3-phosphoglycerate dehydrogenase